MRLVSAGRMLLATRVGESRRQSTWRLRGRHLFPMTCRCSLCGICAKWSRKSTQRTRGRLPPARQRTYASWRSSSTNWRSRSARSRCATTSCSRTRATPSTAAMIGQRFGRLVVLGATGEDDRFGHAFYAAERDCGAIAPRLLATTCDRRAARRRVAVAIAAKCRPTGCARYTGTGRPQARKASVADS